MSSEDELKAQLGITKPKQKPKLLRIGLYLVNNIYQTCITWIVLFGFMTFTILTTSNLANKPFIIGVEDVSVAHVPAFGRGTGYILFAIVMIAFIGTAIKMAITIFQLLRKRLHSEAKNTEPTNS